MYAMIRLGNGKYYTSAVFGYFCPVTAKDDYEIYLEKIYNQYYLVLNAEKTRLIKQYIFDRNSEYLDPKILILDANKKDWITIDAEQGCVYFLSGVAQTDIAGEISSELLQMCIDLDGSCHFVEYPEIKTEQDIENLMHVSGGFHDGYIEKCEKVNDTVYVLFNGVWGCRIEVWFEGDVSFSIESRKAEMCVSYWFGSTVLLENGYVYLVDDDNMKVDGISDNYCWFKAKRMKYHVIPNE